jgi:hypothetical protein
MVGTRPMVRWDSRWVRRQWRREGRVRKILMVVLGIVDEVEEEEEEGLQAWEGGEVLRLRVDMVVVGVRNLGGSWRRRGRSRGIIDIARL